MRVGTPNEKCIEIQGPTGRTYDFRKGLQDVHPHDAKAIVAEGGFIPSMTGTTSAGLGFRCSVCGFGSFFKRCSRCKTDTCVREVVHAV